MKTKTLRRLLGFLALVLLGLFAIAYWWVNFYPNFPHRSRRRTVSFGSTIPLSVEDVHL